LQTNTKTLLVGEPMGLFIAGQQAPLEDVTDYSFAIAGAEFNVAVGLTRLQHRVSYLTRLGCDPFGAHIRKFMAQNGIDTDLITTDDTRRTGFMLKGNTDQGDPQIFYFRAGSAASALCPADAETLSLEGITHIHFTGITPALSQSCREMCLALAQKGRRAGCYISFDPNLRPQLWPGTAAMTEYINAFAAGADLVLPGIGEGRLLTGLDTPEQIGEYYLAAGAGAVVVKNGPAGAYYATAGQKGTVPGFAVKKVVDTVGAGDGFAVGVLSALQEGLPLPEAVRRGNAIGAIQVMSRGDNDGLPTREELADFMAGKEIAR